VRETGREIVNRFDEAFELGQQLLESLRAGWLEALRTDVGVERKLGALARKPRAATRADPGRLATRCVLCNSLRSVRYFVVR